MVSDMLSQKEYGYVVDAQAETVLATDEEDLSAERELAIEYNEKLLGSRTIITDPFDPDQEQVTDEEYERVLNLGGDGVMATITIPKIHVELPVYHGTSDEALQKGVGHLQETSVPIGGESTHCVLSGHTGLPSSKIFDNLDQLEVGDYFIITVLGEDHAYRVTSTEVVLPDETESLVIQPGEDLVTLVTCTPYGVNTHRLLVHAERCEVPDEWLEKGDDETFPAGYSDPPDKALLPSVLLGLLLAALIIGGYVGVTRWRKAHAARASQSPKGGQEIIGTRPTSSVHPIQRPIGAVPHGAQQPVRSASRTTGAPGVSGGAQGVRPVTGRARQPYAGGTAGVQPVRPVRHKTTNAGSRHSAAPVRKLGLHAAPPNAAGRSNRSPKTGGVQGGRHFRAKGDR
ncbi:class C sortase [Collinsella tanakaei]|nr:class C sortase [Collinsella tanakaei]